MRNLLVLAVIALMVSCNSAEPETTTVEVERKIGFNTMLPDLKWHLGTEDAVTLVKELDKVWAAQNYDEMGKFFADTATFYFEDGKKAESPNEFIAMLKEESEGVDISWTFDYAFSVDLDPTRGGEHVQAGFTGTGETEEGESKKYYHESYYVIDGKIVIWRQYSMDISDDE
jgi:hypothetical protein